MKNVKIISTVLFYVTRFAAILYLATTFYSLVSLLTEWSLLIKEDGNFAVCFLFT